MRCVMAGFPEQCFNIELLCFAMGTNYKGSPRERAALDAFIKLQRAAESIADRTNTAIRESGLTFSQFSVLEALYHLGRLTQKELAGKILRSAGNMTMVIDNLEKSGLAKRERCEEDRRVVYVSLEARGRDLIRRIFPEHVKEIVSEMSVLNAAELRELGRLCKKLGLNAETK
jgi:MarR family transcriptional regulator, 2-MHQ and catechol-resistance regulon repressor